MALSTHPAIPLPSSGGSGEAKRLRLSLLGSFELLDDNDPVVLSGDAQRLLAFVALERRKVSRDAIAEALWPEVSPAHSEASLLSAIEELEQLAQAVMIISGLELELSPEVFVDLEDANGLSERILIGDTMPSEGDISSAAIEVLSSELLPNWYEDWAVIRAEDWRQLRLHVLETFARKLLDAGRLAEAVESASEGRRADPLRESFHALTMLIHLAEGNHSETIQAFLAYRHLLLNELGIAPTPQLRALIRPLMT